MSKKEQYAIMVKDIYIEERVHNWVTSCLKARLQDEEQRFNRRIEALKQKRDELQADLIGLGELPMFQKNSQQVKQVKQLNPAIQQNTKQTKTESLIQKLEQEIELASR